MCHNDFEWYCLEDTVVTRKEYVRRRNLLSFPKIRVKRPINSQLNCAILLRDIIPDRKLSNLRSLDRPQNCPFQLSFTHRTAQFSQTTPQFPQFTCPHHDDIISRHSNSTSVSINPFNRWTPHDISLSKYHFLLHILRFLFFFSDNIMADVASKQQTTVLFLPTTVTCTRRHTELTKKLSNLIGNMYCQKTFSSDFRVAFLHS
jgi:hypothetical protein